MQTRGPSGPRFFVSPSLGMAEATVAGVAQQFAEVSLLHMHQVFVIARFEIHIRLSEQVVIDQRLDVIQGAARRDRR